MVNIFTEQRITELTLRIANCYTMEKLHHDKGALIAERNCRRERHRLEQERMRLQGVTVEVIEEETLKFGERECRE